MGSWFSKKSDDYETVLSKLAESIDKTKAQLADIRLRERRTTLLFTIYSFFVWIAYGAAWYMELLPRSWGRTDTLRALRAVPLAAIPIIIFSIRRLVQMFYSWRASAEERTLRKLLAEQKGKITEIKKKTNYDSTRNLLEKYGETSARPDQPSPLRQRIPPQVAAGSQPSTPSRPFGTPATGTPVGVAGPRVVAPYLQPSGAALPPPQTRKWYDTLADALLGPDEQAASREKYALICAKCFNHNGLVAPSEWEDIQYKCPKCGHFNPSRRSLRSAQSALSPTTPATPVSAVARRPEGDPALNAGVSRIEPNCAAPIPAVTEGSKPGGSEPSVDKDSADDSMMDVDAPVHL